MIRIQSAIDLFFKKNGRIPCPKPSLQSESLEKCHGVEEQAGVIPFEELDLPFSVAQDGEGKPFLYVISETSQIKQDFLHFDVLPNEITLVTDHNVPIQEMSYLLLPGGVKKSLVFPYSTPNMEFRSRDQMKEILSIKN